MIKGGQMTKTKTKMTVAEFAEHMGISPATVYKQLNQGMPHNKVKRGKYSGDKKRALIRVNEAEKWIRER